MIKGHYLPARSLASIAWILSAALAFFAGSAAAQTAAPPAAAPAGSTSTPTSAGGAGATLAADAQKPQEKPEETPAGRLFGTKCTSCHFIKGTAAKIGPSLLGVTDRRPVEWITRFLTSPTKMLDGGDPTAMQLLKEMNNVRMPEQNLTPEMIAGLIKFFAACTAKGGCDPISGPKLGIDGTAEEIAAGRDLFVGAKPFANGGPACAQCHHARGVGLLGGGTVGPDLTFSWAKLHDAAWAEALLQSPLEKKAYEGHALSDVEKFQLRSFVADLARDGTRAPAPDDFFDIGLLSGLATLGFIGIFWVSRNGGART